MSLIGSLEDLSLGDILQIISLSQKSGVLVVRTDDGEGRMLFRSGMVCGATVKQGPCDLRSLLIASGEVSGENFDEAESFGDDENRTVSDALVELGFIDADRLQELQRKAIESAAFRMFGWQSGEFSFDVREGSQPEDPPVFSPAGINPQYLAMEGARQDDEQNRFGGEAGGDAAESEPGASAPQPEEDIDLFGSVAEAAVRSTDDGADADASASVGEAAAAAPADEAGGTWSHLPAAIAIDDDLLALEWLKAALQPAFDAVHIFQRQDLGLTRIRQYLARAQTPCVFVSADVAADHLSGIADSADFVGRLKQQAPQMPVVWLGQYGVALPERGAADGSVRRPSKAELRDARAEAQRETSAQVLREELRAVLDGPPPPDEAAAGAASDGAGVAADPALVELRDLTQRLRDASTRGEVLPLVISFASQRFARVAMFLVRDDGVTGMVGRGDGVDEAALQNLQLGREESAWLSSAIEQGTVVQAPPQDSGDGRIVAALGGAAPAIATVAPIESGGRPVALLYGDGGPGSSGSVEPAALEVVLHQAGLALDRAALERALAESESA